MMILFNGAKYLEENCKHKPYIILKCIKYFHLYVHREGKNGATISLS